MTTRTEVVAEARRWIGTKFAHQQRTCGLASDCLGMVGGVAVNLGIVPSDWWQKTVDPVYGGYSRQPSQGRLREGLARFLIEIDPSTAQAGDVPLMRFTSEPQHVGVLADYRHGGFSIVHALATTGAVSEHRMSRAWQKCVVAAFRYPGVV